MTSTTYTVHDLETSLVPAPVPYATLVPDDAGTGLPILLFLHGGGGSYEYLEQFRSVFEDAWGSGALPPMVVATPSAGRSFYLDYHDRDELWESFLVEELVPHVRATNDAAETVAVSGISMGGMGALRLALRHPDDFVAVAAVEPAIEATADWDDVLIRDRIYRPDDLLHSLYGDPVDHEHYRTHHPLYLAHTNAPAIAASDLAIYFECGSADKLHLQYGAEALHRLLFDLAIAHEFRLVRNADHVGPTVAPRVADALAFVGRALDATPAEPDPMVEMLASGIAGMEVERGYRRTETVDGPAGPIEVRVVGEGPAVVLIPSLGRGAGDFDDLAGRLAREGFTAIAPEPRGIGGSTGELDGLSMFDLAADVAAVIAALGVAPATVVGHAFGNRITRMTATEHPDLVESCVLLACGGLVKAATEHTDALQRVFDVEASDEDHLAAVATAFFAPGNDASVWFDGWHAIVAYFQSQATSALAVEHWWQAGAADVLVVQPADDVIALPANATATAEQIGDRASVVTIPRSGHALLPEQPEAVVTTILRWLRDRGR